jgi:hypothetical protein
LARAEERPGVDVVHSRRDSDLLDPRLAEHTAADLNSKLRFTIQVQYSK